MSERLSLLSFIRSTRQSSCAPGFSISSYGKGNLWVAFMSPAFAGSFFYSAHYPQLALWATNITSASPIPHFSIFFKILSA